MANGTVALHLGNRAIHDHPHAAFLRRPRCTIILAGLLHLGVPLLVVLFAYFALRQLYFLTKTKVAGLDLVWRCCGRDCRCSRLFSLVRPFWRCRTWLTPRFLQPAPGLRSARLSCHSPILIVSGKSSSTRLDRKQAHYLRNVANFARSTTAVLAFCVLWSRRSWEPLYQNWPRPLPRHSSR